MTDSVCLLERSCDPPFLASREYLHGTTLLYLFRGCFLEAIGATPTEHQIVRFRVLKQASKRGSVFVYRGNPPKEVARSTIQAEATAIADGLTYTIQYRMTSDPMVRREAYDEEAQVPATRSVCRDAMSFESVDVGDFQDWIRKVVACNKTLCHHAYGDHPYRWVQLTGLDLSAVDQVLSAGKSELFLSLESIRRGVLHQDYIDSLVIDKGAEPAVEFKICFCHPSQW